MKHFSRRRLRHFACFLLLAAFVICIGHLSRVALRDASRTTGWSLFGVVLLLALYNVRKKAPFLPLGSSAGWLQLHIYAGLVSAVAFGVHVQWRLPGGPFGWALAGSYVAVFCSGVFGLLISRSFPRRLTTRGQEVLFERIPIHRMRLESEVEEVVLKCTAKAESMAVAEFYAKRLKQFFSRTRNGWQHLLQSGRPLQAIQSEMKAYDRYLNDVERDAMSQIAIRVRTKDDLDYQYALQATLKYWLFAHVPLTYGLLVFTLFHLLLVYAFRGGAS